jgi:hypothetical protein
MNLRTFLMSSFVLLLLAAGDAAAQKLALRIDQGLVTLDAENVTVDEVLARWIQATGLSVVSKGGQGSDIPVSLHLQGVSERDALKMVLRDLSGYIMGERVEQGTGVVKIDRLVILTESAPRVSDVMAPATRTRPEPVADPTADDDVPQTPIELAPTLDPIVLPRS